jgi:hypothetical protein
MSLMHKVLVSGTALALLGCPPGTKTTVDFTVKVGADTCRDAGVTSPDEDSAVIDCVKASGEGSVRILFPRSLWYRMQAPRTEGK